MSGFDIKFLEKSQPRIPRALIDVFCPIHGNWLGHYEYGSTGIYYCWCKKCKKEIKIVMTI